MLMLYRTPSYLISLFDVKLIKLPMYESAEVLDLEASAAIFLQFRLLEINELSRIERDRERERGGSDVAEVLVRFDLFGAQN